MIQTEHISKDQTLKITFPGDLTSTNHEEFHKQLEASFTTHNQSAWSNLIIDLSLARLVDSMGLNVLLSLIHKAKARQASIHCLITSRTIHRILLFTRLEKQMEIEFKEQTAT